MPRLRSLLTFSVALLLATCLATSAAAVDLAIVPTPALQGASADVKQRVADARATVEARRAAGGQPLAEAFGELGTLYLHFGFPGAASTALANASTLDGTAQWFYYLAVAHEANGDARGAIAALRRVLGQREGNLPAVVRLADLLVEHGDREEAKFLYEAALQSPLGVPAGRAGLGQLALDAGDPELAAANFQAALEAQPEATALRYALGLAYRELGRIDEARDLLTQTGGQAVRFPDPLMSQLGLRYDTAGGDSAAAGRAAQRGELGQAAAGFRDAVAQNPDDLQSRRSLAMSLLQSGDRDGAKEQFRAILDRDPGNASAQMELGTITAAAGQLDQAATEIQKAVDMAPDFREARLRLARVLVALGRLGDAIPHQRKAVELDPRDPQGHLLLARGLLETNQPDDARSAIDRLLELEPGNLDGLILRGRIAAVANDPDAAEADFARVASLSSATADQRARGEFNLALLRQAQSRLPEAVERYRQTLVFDPQHREALFNLAVIMASNGQLDEAIDLYQRLFDLDPNASDVRFRLAVSLMNRGDHWPALGHFEALHQANPDAIEPLLSSALLMAEVGQGDQAAERLSAAASRFKADGPKARVLSTLGGVEIGNGKVERGLSQMRQAAELATDRPEIRLTYARALAAEKRYRDAATQFAAYADVRPDDESARFQQTMTLIFTERWADARDVLQTITARSSSISLTHLYARLLATAPDDSVRDGERAVSVAEAVFGAQRNPAHGETLAMAMAAAGRFDEAIALQDRLLQEAQTANFDQGFIDRVQRNLERYRANQIGVSDW
ncbi:MAG: tetratricopeptide repeat protein [Acidobacteriota bacterium]